MQVRYLFLIFAFMPALAFSKLPPSYEHAISVYGTPKYEKGFTHFSFGNKEAPKGGRLRLGTVGTFDSLLPFIVKGIPVKGYNLTMVRLMCNNPEEVFTQYGNLAEEVKVDPKRRWIAYKLREEAKWSDGAPITAEDVKFSWESWKKVGRPNMRLYYSKIGKFEVLGPHELRLTLKENEPEDREIVFLMGLMPIIPKHYYEKQDLSKTTLTPPVGGGPYRIKTVKPGHLVVYERVKNYWGADIPCNKGGYNFDEIWIYYFRNHHSLYQAFKAGKIDMIEETDPRLWHTEYNFRGSQKKHIKKLEFPHETTVGMTALAFNTRRELFKDKRVRKAIDLAFNFSWINRNFYYNSLTPTRSYFENTEMAAKGKPEGLEREILEEYRGRVPEEVFGKAYTQACQDKRQCDTRANLQKAQALLKEAGWVLKDGLLVHEGTGKTFEFEIALSDASQAKILGPFVQNLERLGIKARLNPLMPSQYEQRRIQFDFDMLWTVWGQIKLPGNMLLYYWGQEAADQNGSRNYPAIKDPIVDEVIGKMIKAPDYETLVHTARALDRILMAGHYVVPLFYVDKSMIAHWDTVDHPEAKQLEYPFVAWWATNKGKKT